MGIRVGKVVFPLFRNRVSIFFNRLYTYAIFDIIIPHEFNTPPAARDKDDAVVKSKAEATAVTAEPTGKALPLAKD